MSRRTYCWYGLALSIVLMLTLCFPLLGDVPGEEVVKVEAFMRLCPDHRGGDREYKGHGPKVHAWARLSVRKDSRELWVVMYLHAKETKRDWTEAEGKWERLVYTAPTGHVIDEVLSDDASETSYTDTNHTLDTPAVRGGTLVSKFEIMGDTGGKDVGNCTDDDVYMNVYFNDVKLKIQRGDASDQPQVSRESIEEIVTIEAKNSELVHFDKEAWHKDRQGAAPDPAVEGTWYAVCYCGDGWQAGPFRFQDQAERAANSHNCWHHWCIRCADVPWWTVAASDVKLADNRCTHASCCQFNQIVPPNHRHTFRCGDATCCYFQQCVAAGHQHWRRCGDATCCHFQQCVAPDHQHWRRCNDATCCYFQQCVAPTHAHWRRCNDARCTQFQQCVPPDHKHSYPADGAGIGGV